MLTKQEIRRQVTSIRKANYDKIGLLELSREITHRLEEHRLFQEAHCVLLFASLSDEVNTHDLIQRYYTKKKILLPSVVGESMELHQYEGTSEVGAFNISEATGPLVTDYSEIDLAVIPGVAFDSQGHRLGRGKGYYDRFLPLLSCHTVGLCFPFQLLESLPTEPHDKNVNEIITWMN